MTEYLSHTHIIIVTYNGMPWIENCLRSCIGYPVVVVDNASTDGTPEFIKERFPTIHLIPQTENLGFGQANNLGICYAMEQNAAYVFLLNQDAYLQENCIETLLGVHSTNKDYGILSPVHLNGKGDYLDSNFSNYVNYQNSKDFYSDYVLKKEVKKIYNVPFLNAAGWLLPRLTLETVGGFDPIFFHYGEDDNYCQRVLYHGFEIGVVPEVFLRHDREDRKNIATADKDVSYFKNLERKWKVAYGNINVDNLGKLQELLKKRKRALFLSRLKLKPNSKLEKEINLITTILPELIQSRSQNKQNGRHYLNGIK